MARDKKKPDQSRLHHHVRIHAAAAVIQERDSLSAGERAIRRDLQHEFLERLGYKFPLLQKLPQDCGCDPYFVTSIKINGFVHPTTYFWLITKKGDGAQCEVGITRDGTRMAYFWRAGDSKNRLRRMSDGASSTAYTVYKDESNFLSRFDEWLRTTGLQAKLSQLERAESANARRDRHAQPATGKSHHHSFLPGIFRRLVEAIVMEDVEPAPQAVPGPERTAALPAPKRKL